MQKKEIEVFSEASNAAIVRMPGRRFPGSVIQGDSLSHLRWLAEDLRNRLRDHSEEDLRDTAQELFELLDGRLRHYVAVLDAEGIPLPFNRPPPPEPELKAEEEDPG
ncbi:hypothetical protein ATI61_110191 [Archangium gephyra]|uniref:Uncharacterized protein n=1 Tax=Archangium gephyra TaxID=48 RepID=A0AAC8QEQ4_9BACT|nr:hypothetical protein [Archangium gephyra]AKJ06064.1 Hypothetical protein AA314_07690 [Archangium gephyra]REG27184.1 hypothetical protein ATI61_110191 [Archangium gephyra]